MLLEARCSLRFTKLEKRSPAMAKVATRVPTSHPSPISAAQMDVANTDTTMPRMVRVVAKRPDKRISLIRLAKDKNRVAFRPDHLAVADLRAAEPNAADLRPRVPGIR
jgi:hypothetical protein